MLETEPMNLLFIFSDQHSKNMLGCYGNSYIKTPNLDALASDGVCFTSAYTNSPVCVPARAAMATGNYASRNAFWDNAHAFDGSCDSWAKRLEKQGRSVTTIGKLHFKNDSPATGFLDQRIPLNIKNGVGDIYGCIREKNTTRVQFKDVILQAGYGNSDYLRYDTETASLAATFLKNEAPKKKNPFALYVGFVSPHFPLIAPKEFFDLYDQIDKIPEPIHFYKDLWQLHPVIDEYRHYCGTENITYKEALQAIRSYYALCSFMDFQVGIVLKALKESGLDKTTRIIYSTDHGDTMGEHGVFFKSTMYEGSAGIPLIVSGPDIPKGEKRATNVSLVDIFPTVLEATGTLGTQSDSDLPGISLWNIAKDSQNEVTDRVVYSEYFGFGTTEAGYMVKKRHYKLIEYISLPPQLFDLHKDPQETRNVAEDTEYSTILQELHAELHKICNTEELDRQSKAAQKAKLLEQGGKEAFLKTFRPTLFSPIPKLN